MPIKEADTINGTPILEVPQSTERHDDPDSEFGEMATQCLGIPGRRKQDSTSNTGTENNSAPKILPLIIYDPTTHIDLTAGRVNFRKPIQSGLNFPALGQFSGLGHQNSPLHK